MKDLLNDVFDIALWLALWLMAGYALLCAGAFCASAATSQLTAADEIATRVIAVTILAEARGEGEAGMYMVAAVIEQRSLNRKKSPLSIVRERLQFSCWNNTGAADHNYLLTESKHAAYAWKLAYWIHQGFKTKKTYIDRARYDYVDHYYNPKWANPSWKKSSHKTITYKNHIFMRLKEKPIKLR